MGCGSNVAQLNNNESTSPQELYVLPSSGDDIISHSINDKPNIDSFILPPQFYRQGVVINIAAMRIYSFNNNQVFSSKVALGREGWRTPLTKTTVYRKTEAPVWTVPASIKKHSLEKHGKILPDVVPAGPGNPLGDYAIYLHLPGYLIHGTNDPKSIGHLVSSGCIRMDNRDVAILYNRVNPGTPVSIIYYPNIVGWKDNLLYLEVYHPISHEKQIYEKAEIPTSELIQQAIANRPAIVDWAQVQAALQKQSGIPTLIGRAK